MMPPLDAGAFGYVVSDRAFKLEGWNAYSWVRGRSAEICGDGSGEASWRLGELQRSWRRFEEIRGVLRRFEALGI